MARMRCIKPEFWTSEQVVECEPMARLLFIGMWNFCDDGGNHPASVKTLKMEVFPGDEISDGKVRELVGELIHVGLLQPYEALGKEYWHVTGWHHQKIDQPTFRYPMADGTIPDGPPKRMQKARESSTLTSQSFGDVTAKHQLGFDGVTPPERKGEERSKHKAISYEIASRQPGADDGIPDCPHQEIRDLYAKTLSMLPQPRVWEGQRADNLRTRWRWVMTAKKPSGQRYATTREEGIEFFDRFFRYVSESDFLVGRNDAWRGCDLAWLVKAENFAKVIEGKYENKEAA